jgi:beta-galactosidase
MGAVADICNRTTLRESGVLDLPSIAPGKTEKVRLKFGSNWRDCGPDSYLTVSFRLRSSSLWAEAGHEVAWFQHLYHGQQPKIPQELPPVSQSLDVEGNETSIRVTGNDFTFIFDKHRGYLTHWLAGNMHLLEPDPATGAAIIPSFWRSPTDNDKPRSLPYWQRFGVDALTSQLRSTEVSNDTSTSAAKITFTTFLTPPILDWGYLATTTYTISASPTSPGGRLTISVHLSPAGSYPPKHVPRAGLNLRLPRALDEVEWLGLGPGESYPDKRAAQRVGVWGPLEVAGGMHTHYEVPQEGGNRMGTRWVSLRGGGEAGGLRVTAADDGWSRNCGGGDDDDDGFSFRVSRYSDEAAQAARHPCDLVEEQATLLRLDARVAGVGTGACGPDVREDLLVPVEEMRFGFCLEPVGV